MIRVHLQPPGGASPERGDLENLEAMRAREGWLWIDMRDEDTEAIEDVAARFSLNPFAVEDATADTHYPKVDDFDDHVFVVLHGLATRGDRLATIELDAFIGKDYLITIHRGEAPSIEWAQREDEVFAPSPDLMLARIAETSVRRFLPLIEAIDDELDGLEERAVAGDGSVVPEIQALRRDAVRVRRTIGPQREVFADLSRPFSHLVGDRAQLRFASVYDHHIRLAESLDSGRALLQATLDTYRSTVAERMNEVMKVLTVYAAILLPLSLLAGIYGMNFTNIPELEWRYGYFGLLALMATVAIGQWLYFARRGFVGGVRFARVPRVVGRGLVRLAHLPVEAVVTIAKTAERLVGDDEEPPER